MSRMRIIFLLLGAFAAFTAGSQEWPQKTVRIIVPFPAGGSADLMPRIVAEKLSQQWGQPVIVDNRPGAAGNIGATAVFQAEPDGYTLLSAPPPPLVINRLLYPKLSYDSTQFVPMTVIGAIPNVLLVHPKVKANTVQEFIAFAKANPGKLNYASQGSGTTSHLTAELFKSMAGGLNITHVPYKGTAPALADLLGGQVEMMCDNLGVSLPHVRAGKLKALAVSTRTRSPLAPEVPTVHEAGVPGYDVSVWFGVLTVAGTPREVVQRLNTEMVKVLTSPEIKERFAKQGVEVVAGTPEHFAGFLRSEVDRWAKVVKDAGIKAD